MIKGLIPLEINISGKEASNNYTNAMKNSNLENGLQIRQCMM